MKTLSWKKMGIPATASPPKYRLGLEDKNTTSTVRGALIGFPLRTFGKVSKAGGQEPYVSSARRQTMDPEGKMTGF